MIKLCSNCFKKNLKIGLITYIFSFPSFCLAEGLEVLADMPWEFSYSVDGTPYVSKMELSNFTTNNDGKKIVEGLFYRNKNGIESDSAACGSATIMLDKKTANTLNIDYFCVASGFSSGEPYLTFGFKILGDSITNGIISTASNFIESAFKFPLDNSPMTGFRVVTESSKTGEAVYNEKTGELVIPSVLYNNLRYYVTLQEMKVGGEGGLAFSVKEARLLNDLSEEYSVYIEEDDQLIIPSVIYKNAKYTVILWQVGFPDELIFVVTDVFPITAQ